MLCQRLSSKMRPEVSILELTTTGVIGDSDKQFWCGDGGESLTGICLEENHKLETLNWGQRNEEWCK